MSNIEVIDRRRNKDHHEAVKVEEPAKKGKAEWDDVGYVLAIMRVQDGGFLIVGRAAGVRKDGVGPFIADYIVPNVWISSIDWMREAKKRLDTFLECGCTTANKCGIHDIYLKDWVKADSQRLSLVNSMPMSKALEMAMRAEMAASSKNNQNLVVPR